MRTHTQAEPTHQDYVVRYVAPDDLPDECPWALVRCDEGTYFLAREDLVCPAMIEAAWAAYRWMALNRPHSRPNVPVVVPAQRPDDAWSIRDAVIRGHRS